MIKHLFGLALISSALAFAQTGPIGEYQGNCEQGNTRVVTAATNSTSKVMGSFPACTVSVYITGSDPATLADLYSNATGSIKANPFTANADGSFQFFTSERTVDVRKSGGGIPSPFTLGNQNVLFPNFNSALNITLPPCQVKSDPDVDYSGAFQTCLGIAGMLGIPMYIPTDPFYICDVTYNGFGNITAYGDDKNLSTLHPFGGSSGCDVPLTINTSGDVYLHDLGCDFEYTGHFIIGGSFCVYITGPGTPNNQTPPNSVTLDHVKFSGAKNVGLQCQPCQNVTATNSEFVDDYWIGLSIASSGTPASPLYVKNYNVHDNRFSNTGIGVGFNFFVSNISVTSNVFDHSGVALVQTPFAYAVIEDNTFNGVPTSGCYNDSQCGSLSAQYNPIFLEGAAHWVVGVNHVSNINGANGVLNAGGSNLTIVSQMELPTTDGHVDGLIIENSDSGFPLLLNGISNGPNPVVGRNLTIKNTKLTNVNECPNIGEAIGIDVSNNYCEGATNGGYTVGNAQSGSFHGNVCRNCNTANGTTIAGGTLSATNGNPVLTGSGTAWVAGVTTSGIITIAGTPYSILSRASDTSITLTVPYAGTTGSGLSYSLHYGGGGSFSGLTINGDRTHVLQINGNIFQNDKGSLLSGINDTTGLDPSVSLIRYDTTNSCTGGCNNGLYLPALVLTPTFTDCGTSPSGATYNTNSQGVVVIGAGTISSCTIVFAYGGFNQAPACSFIAATGSPLITFLRGPGTTGAQFVFTTASAVDMHGVTIQYTCFSAAGSASTGWFPYQ